MIRWAHRFLVCARAGTNGGSAVQLLASLFRRALWGWPQTSPPKPLNPFAELVPHNSKKCYLCARKNLLPMCPNAHILSGSGGSLPPCGIDPRLMAGNPSGILPTSTTACFFNSLLRAWKVESIPAAARRV